VRILIIGSGGREDAIAHSLAQEQTEQTQPVHQLHAAPGNPGIGRVATLHTVNINDPQAVTALAQSIKADLVVVGPEAPLVAGVADAVRAAGIACFGPSAQAAQLEGSKAFAKDVMAAAGVPTARAVVATDRQQAEQALAEFHPPYVVKNDGLAAGKGVVVTDQLDQALAHAQACLDAGAKLVIEEYLDGPEISLFCITDGTTVLPLAPAQDFKRALDGDQGPNTGGMGAYSPLPWAPADLTDQVMETVARPTVAEMAKRGTPFQGVLYCGLALTSRGLRVVEFNARFGDPETQVVLPRLKTPLAEVLLAAAQGRLNQVGQLEWSSQAAVTVVVAAQGYPGTPVTGRPVTGVERAEQRQNVSVLHAGTALCGDGELVSAGGRVLNVVGMGKDLAAARTRAYVGVSLISLEGSHHRTDIAQRASELCPLECQKRSSQQLSA
jgi:phosphoribosylamine--glycine ligase